MEIILKKDVDNLGFKDDIVIVKNGYGRNYLIPQGWAILATTSAKKVLAENLKQRAFKEMKIVEEANAKIAKIKEMDIKISVKVGQKNKLFGSVSNNDVVKVIGKQGVNIHNKNLTILGKTVKQLGKYTATVRLHREVVAQIPFEVIAETTKKK